MSRSARPVKQSDIAEMLALAKAGHCAKAIARRIGRSRDTVSRYCGDHLVPARDRLLTVDDLREWYAASRAERETIAEQHGYASAQSMCVVVSRMHAKLRAGGVDLPTRQDLRVKRGRARAIAVAREFGSMELGADLSGILARHGLTSPQALYQLAHRGRRFLAGGKGRAADCAAVRAKILQMADAGFKAEDIADEVGYHINSVHRIAAGRLKAKAPSKVADVARLKRIVKASEAAERGTRDELAARFGLRSRSSFRGVVCYARKMLAAEART